MVSPCECAKQEPEKEKVCERETADGGNGGTNESKNRPVCLDKYFTDAGGQSFTNTVDVFGRIKDILFVEKG